jgi:hypothetical protein
MPTGHGPDAGDAVERWHDVGLSARRRPSIVTKHTCQPTTEGEKHGDAPKDNLVPSNDLEDKLDSVEDAQVVRPQIAKDLRAEKDNVRPSRG